MSSQEHWAKLFPELVRTLRAQTTLSEARATLVDFVNKSEAATGAGRQDLSALEYYVARDCRRVLHNILSPRNEALAGFSATKALWQALRDPEAEGPGEGFWQEMTHLFLGLTGRSGIYDGVKPPRFLSMSGREAGRERSRELNRLGKHVQRQIARYPSGLDNETLARRVENRRRVLEALGGTDDDWTNPAWQLRNIIRDAETLGKIVRLTDEEREAITRARAECLPFGITPHYASLMDFSPHRRRDHAVRAQVIPTLGYVEKIGQGRTEAAEELDFMREADTAPVDLVTRRYPRVAIFKPFNTCAQICIYCQRNWEIDDAMQPGALAPREKINRALAWFRRQKALSEVLITGGDPLMLSDGALEHILKSFSRMEHIVRVRIGTRAPVVLPQRFTDKLLGIFARFHTDTQRLALVTHFEHPYEMSAEARDAVRRLREMGLSIYNQEVFTIENSRKFETTALRVALKAIGIDPYYCFCAKGKEETQHFRVPVARMLQERKEEARLTPGSVRTDEPVFNLPRLGKNYLRAGQDHHIIGIMSDGARVYEFLPWEKNLYPSPTYIHRDVPIHDYLQRLAARGEDVAEYRNIWYYF